MLYRSRQDEGGLSKKAEVKQILETVKEDAGNPCGAYKDQDANFRKHQTKASAAFRTRAKSFSASIETLNRFSMPLKQVYSRGRQVDSRVMAKPRVNFYADASEDHEDGTYKVP